jgi:hypothetical protein
MNCPFGGLQRILEPIRALSGFLGQILLKPGGNACKGKNECLLFVSFLKGY